MVRGKKTRHVASKVLGNPFGSFSDAKKIIGNPSDSVTSVAFHHSGRVSKNRSILKSAEKVMPHREASSLWIQPLPSYQSLSEPPDH